MRYVIKTARLAGREAWCVSNKNPMIKSNYNKYILRVYTWYVRPVRQRIIKAKRKTAQSLSVFVLQVALDIRTLRYKKISI